jgi:hypothetical protein
MNRVDSKRKWEKKKKEMNHKAARLSEYRWQINLKVPAEQ